MSAHTLARPGTARPLLSMRGLLDRFAVADASFRQRQQLAFLDDRMLRDIGATRADVSAELRGR